MTRKRGKLIDVFILLLPLLIDQTQTFDAIVDKLSIGRGKNYTLNDKREYIIEIQHLPDDVVTKPPRISVKCNTCVEQHPLLVVVMQNSGVLSWELPFVVHSTRSTHSYQKMQQTLCPFDLTSPTESYHLVNQSGPLRISLSTSSNKTVVAEVIVYINENFLVGLDSNLTVEVAPSSPSFSLFKFPKDVTSVLVKVTSPDDLCMIVSVQNVSCPVFDLEENVRYKGHFQTVTRQGGLTLFKDAFPDGFYIVLVMELQEDYCTSKLYAREKFKNVTLAISKTITVAQYQLAVGITLSVIISIFLILFTIFYCSFKSEWNLEVHLDDALSSSMQAGPSTYKEDASETVSSIQSSNTLLRSDSNPVIGVEDYNSILEQDFDSSFRKRRYLKVCHLARKEPSQLQKKTKLYVWNVLIVAIFYLLPVGQLVFNYQFEFNKRGSDLCFYNFLCSHPLWFFADFNHVFSNIGYISFGSLFLILTHIKEKIYRYRLSSNEEFFRDCGIPQHFGLFYAMGASLIIEGVLSSCYHLCPNQYNIQFDTTFMYVICTLCMVKIYQARHADVSANASSTFFLLAVVLLFVAYGVFMSNLLFWTVFTIVHLLVCVHLSLKIYYLGRSSLACQSIRRVYEQISSGEWSFQIFRPVFPSRFILLFIGNACNWALIILRFVYGSENVSSYFLTIFMVNLLLYTIFYIIMKFISREKLLLQTILYIVLATGFWFAAMYFFLAKTISWKETPAQSKLYNKACEILDFYDNHDIWHFLSAAAMFFSFMVLLTLDEDLVSKPRSEIAVF